MGFWSNAISFLGLDGGHKTGITGLWDRFRNGNTNETNERVAAETNASNERIAAQTNELNKQIADQNLQFQQSQFEYQKALNQTQMQREDTAIQRQVADSRAAGISPLAGLSGAASAPLTSAEAPQNGMQYQGYQAQGWQAQGDGPLGLFKDLISLKSANTQAAQQVKDAQLTDAGITRQKIENSFLGAKMDAEIQNLAAQIRKTNGESAAQEFLNKWNNETKDLQKQKLDNEVKSLTLANNSSEIMNPLQQDYQRIVNLNEEIKHNEGERRRQYNELYGLNDGMSEKERLTTIAKNLGLTGIDNLGKAFQEFYDSDGKHSDKALKNKAIMDAIYGRNRK